jgi:hypothetical protein
MYTTDASDEENDNIKIQCGDTPQNYNLCESSFGQGQRNCSFLSPWSDNLNHTVYCVLNDSFTTSEENLTNISADNLNPEVSNFKINDSDLIVQKSDNIEINITAYDSISGVSNVSISNISSVYMYLSGTDIWQIVTTAANLGCNQVDSNCTLHITAVDSAGNVNDSFKYQITIDDTIPSVQNIAINDSDGIIKSTYQIQINMSVTDTNEVINATVRNNTEIQMYNIIGNIWQTNATPTDLGCTAIDDICTLWFKATDIAGNVNDSVKYDITVDDKAPSVTNLNTNDTDNIVRSTDSINLSATITDSSGVSYASANGDALIQSGDTWYIIQTATDFGCGEGSCIISYSATDILGNTNDSEILNLTVDDTQPYVTLLYPDDNDNFTTGTIEFNFSTEDNIDTNISCNITLDGQINNTEILYVPNGTVFNYSILDISHGLHSWNVTCWDEIPNLNTSQTWQFAVDLLPPNISLESANNITLETTTNSITFEYNVRVFRTDVE